MAMHGERWWFKYSGGVIKAFLRLLATGAPPDAGNSLPAANFPTKTMHPLEKQVTAAPKEPLVFTVCSFYYEMAIAFNNDFCTFFKKEKRFWGAFWLCLTAESDKRDRKPYRQRQREVYKIQWLSKSTLRPHIVVMVMWIWCNSESNASQPNDLKEDWAMVSRSSLKISAWMHSGNESPVDTISCPFQQLWPLTQ